MRLLCAFTHSYVWSPLDAMARRLVRQGHELQVLLDRDADSKFGSGHGFDFSTAPYPVGWMTPTAAGGLFRLRPLRELIDYCAYLSVRKPTSAALARRWQSFLPQRWQRWVRWPLIQAALERRGVWHALRRLESFIPCDPAIVDHLESIAPDAVVAAYAIMPFSKELEYLKAARALGIQTVVVVPSWDNLTTKGTLHHVPDRLLVWNEDQIGEAVRLHGIPKERVVVTGAPRYDPWFIMKTACDRASFCRRVGLDPALPMVVYLCSSEFIAGDESQFVRRLLDELPSRSFSLLIRPHPLNQAAWKQFAHPAGGAAVWPAKLAMNTDLINQDLHDTLFHSAAVIGVNTSAFLEAAIVDRPCVSIMTESHATTQKAIPHFQHLLAGGFLETPQTIAEVGGLLQRLVHGADERQLARRRFVRHFLRPAGLDIPAATIVEQAIAEIAQRRSCARSRAA